MTARKAPTKIAITTTTMKTTDAYAIITDFIQRYSWVLASPTETRPACCRSLIQNPQVGWAKHRPTGPRLTLFRHEAGPGETVWYSCDSCL